MSAALYRNCFELGNNQAMPRADVDATLRAWVILLLVMCAAAADSWYRISFAMMAPTLRSELGLEPVDLGYVFAAYRIGLILGSVVMTVMIARAGIRRTLGVAILGGSLAMALTGAAQGLGGLWVSRACQGFFGGAILAGGLQVVAEWFPPRLRGVATGLFFGSLQLSLCFGPPAIGRLSDHFDRTYMSFFLAGLGLLIFPFWVRLCHPPEFEGPDAGFVSRDLSEVFRKPQTLGLLWVVALAAPIEHFDLGSFLQHQHNVDLYSLGWMPIVPTVLAAAGALLGGLVSDQLIWLGWSPFKSRRVVAVAFALVMVLLLGVFVTNPNVAIVLAGLSRLGYQGCVTVLFAAVADSAPKRGLPFAVLLASTWSGVASSLALPMSLQVFARSGYAPVVAGMVVLALTAAAAVARVLRPALERANEPGAHADERLVGPHGGFGRRLAAFVLDNAICAVPIGIGIGITQPRGEWTIFVILLVFILQWMYFAGLESSTSQSTLGKRALGLLVTDELGQRVSFRQASIRYFGKILSYPLALGFCMAAFTEHRQALHDLIAKCVVVRKTVP